MPRSDRSQQKPKPAAEAQRTVEDHVCTFCGCLCDDLRLSVRGRKIEGVDNACEIGKQRFLDYRDPLGTHCSVDGSPVSFTAAVQRAAELLQRSRAPLVTGLSRTTCEAQRAAVQLADRTGAVVDWTRHSGDAAALLALQHTGQSTCSWGEVAQRADLVIFWGADPLRTHPRHLERYSLMPRSRFLPGGRADRTCIVIHQQPTATGELADLRVTLTPGSDLEALWTMRGLCSGVPHDADRVEAATGQSLAVWSGLLERMKAARYGVVLFGEHLTSGASGQRNCEALFALVRDLNRYTRFACGSLGEVGNAPGAANVLAWQTGYGLGVDFSQGLPRHHGREFLTESVLARNEADAVLAFCLFADEGLKLPSIVLSDQPSDASKCEVWFRTATMGISATGTVYRADEVSLPLRPAVATDVPAAETVLAAIEERLIQLAAAD